MTSPNAPEPARLFPMAPGTTDTADLTPSGDSGNEARARAGWQFIAENSAANTVWELATMRGIALTEARDWVMQFALAANLQGWYPDAVWNQLKTEAVERAELLDWLTSDHDVESALSPHAEPRARTNIDTVLDEFKLLLRDPNLKLFADTQEVYVKHVGNFMRWCPSDTNWNDTKQRTALLSDYLGQGISGEELIRASCSRVFRMLDGEAQKPSKRASQAALEAHGMTARQADKQTSAVRTFARWVSEHRPETDWLNGSDRWATWQDYGNAKPSARRQPSVQKWFSFITGGPLTLEWNQEWSTMPRPDIINPTTVAGLLPPPLHRPMPAATDGSSSNQLAGVAERIQALADSAPADEFRKRSAARRSVDDEHVDKQMRIT